MRGINLLVLLLLGGSTVASATIAPSAAGLPEKPVRAVVLIDVIPSDQDEGLAALKDFVRRARQDKDVTSIDLIQQATFTNHFMLEEVFPSQSAYRSFLSKDYVRAFRAALFPHLGSPWDERPGQEVTP
ncbi:MAG: putative quinol monooxygenase [Sphingomonas sp.]|uniref:putative quinol monooxygenase n=1 Tax=Sphingomonas sp. TaxID=28214 RepID=UPI003F2D64E9